MFATPCPLQLGFCSGFADLGSGRGHALLVAHALFPFRQCIGGCAAPGELSGVACWGGEQLCFMKDSWAVIGSSCWFGLWFAHLFVLASNMLAGHFSKTGSIIQASKWNWKVIQMSFLSCCYRTPFLTHLFVLPTVRDCAMLGFTVELYPWTCRKGWSFVRFCVCEFVT